MPQHIKQVGTRTRWDAPRHAAATGGQPPSAPHLGGDRAPLASPQLLPRHSSLQDEAGAAAASATRRRCSAIAPSSAWGEREGSAARGRHWRCSGSVGSCPNKHGGRTKQSATPPPQSPVRAPQRGGRRKPRLSGAWAAAAAAASPRHRRRGPSQRQRMRRQPQAARSTCWPADRRRTCGSR